MSGKRKTGLTLEQHKRYGAELLAAREMLIEVQKAVGGGYPFRSKAYRKVVRTVEALDRLRDELENLAYGENPELDSYDKRDLYRPNLPRVGGSGGSH